MKTTRIPVLLAIALLTAGPLLTAGASLAADSPPAAERRPQRALTMAAEYPAVQVPPEEAVSEEVVFHNRGRSDETVEVRVVAAPDGWKARLKTYRYTVTGVSVPAGENKTLTFEATPAPGVQPGTYRFRLEAKTPDGHFQLEQPIEVTVERQEKGAQETQGIKLTTSYPVLRGPSDVSFEFSVEVASKLEKDAIFDLGAQAPDGWEVNFKPAYETKYISSLRIKAGQSQTVAVQVKPPPHAAAGQYPIQFRVSSGDAVAKADLAVVLTGTYALDAGTPNGLLSLDVRQGKSANLSIYVKNTGTAANHDIHFGSFKPENWKVAFQPESIDVLEPGDVQQVEVTITPNDDALVGDYSVSADVQGEKASKNLEFRVTVKASAAWGWVGIGIIAAVIAGLAGLFRWLGRR